ncbi:MAG TPA: site-specific integrase [Pyrinomonadaceae bacterium]|nr:site-specific integrase [Pyrinomonadaceae bacterium]
MPIYTDKKTKRLFIKFSLDGIPYKKRLPKTMTKGQAEKLETKWKHTLFFEMNGIVTRNEILFEDFLTDYFLPFAEQNHSKISFDYDVNICKASLAFFRGKKLREIKPGDVEKFKSSRTNLLTQHNTPRKPATVARELSIISKVFSLAVKNDFLDFNPCSKVDKPSFDNVQNKILSKEDEQAFFASFESEWARDICLLVLNTGLRQNDVLGLSKFHVDLKQREIRLVQGKTKRIVEIPLNDSAYEILNKRRHNGSDLFFPSPKTGKQGVSVKKACVGASARAKINQITIRDLRRTFGTRLDEGNYNDSTVAKLLGHSDNRSVYRYKRGKEILREAVNSLDQSNRAKIVPFSKTTNQQIAVNS